MNETLESRRALRQAMKDKKIGPCMDCNKEFPYFVMDLDYVGPRNKFSISRALENANERNLNFILAQLQQSEVVCSNCHRIRDYKRGNRGKR